MLSWLVIVLGCGALGGDDQDRQEQGNSESGVRVWVAGCTEKIEESRRSELPHDGPWDEERGRVRLDAVRGEHVPFQLVVTAERTEVRGVEVRASALVGLEGSIDARQVKLYLEPLVKVYAPTGKHGRKGWWPDPLVPLTSPFDVVSSRRGRPLPRRHQAVWVDVVVPSQLPPGAYTGTLTVSAGGAVLRTVEVELKVWELRLPRERRYPALFGFFYGRDIARLHEVDHDSPEYRRIYLRYLAFLLERRIDPTFISFGLEGGLVDGEYVVRWTDPEIERFLKEHGLLRFAVGCAPPGIPRPSPMTDEYRRHFRQYLEQVIAHARAEGWYERLVITAPVDEPSTAEAYAEVRLWGELVHSVDPALPYAVTEQPVPEDPAFGTLVGAVNQWIVNGGLLDSNREAIARRQAAGDGAIWYISCDQLYPRPNYYIDREAADPRMVAWLTWRYRLGGILYWATTLWRDVRDPWLDPITWKLSHCNAPAAGEGSLLYPGNLAHKYSGQDNVDGPVSSIRLELLREGLEELELLDMLARRDGRAAADEIVDALCRSTSDFSRDPNEIDAARRRLFAALAGESP